MLAPSIQTYNKRHLLANQKYQSEKPVDQQERLIIENLGLLQKMIESKLEELDNDCKETIEIDHFGLRIYVDISTRGWDYRSIELLAVDIMNDNCDALNDAARILFNALKESVDKLNSGMDKLYNE